MLLHSPAKFLEYAQRRLMTHRKGKEKVVYFFYFCTHAYASESRCAERKKNVFLQLLLGIRQA